MTEIVTLKLKAARPDQLAVDIVVDLLSGRYHTALVTVERAELFTNLNPWLAIVLFCKKDG